MAFIDFDPASVATPVFPHAIGRAMQPEAEFSEAELQVLALARHDGLPSLRPMNALDRLIALIFGLTRPNLLADPRLEALRRLAVIARRRGPKRVARELPRFLASGFEQRHCAAVLRLASSS